MRLPLIVKPIQCRSPANHLASIMTTNRLSCEYVCLSFGWGEIPLSQWICLSNAHIYMQIFSIIFLFHKFRVTLLVFIGSLSSIRSDGYKRRYARSSRKTQIACVCVCVAQQDIFMCKSKTQFFANVRWDICIQHRLGLSVGEGDEVTVQERTLKHRTNKKLWR